MAANNNRTQYSLRGILEKEKLTGSNFSGWHRNLRIVLRQERKLHILDDPVPEQPADEAPLAQISAYKKHSDEAEDVACLMLATMSPELQETLQDKMASVMIKHLKTRFGGNKRQERVETSRKLFGCKQGENAPDVPHVNEMLGYVDYLSKLGFPIPDEYAIDLILLSLNSKFSNFLMNYVMKDSDPPLAELSALVGSAESAMLNSKASPILMVSSAKGKRKRRSKKARTGSGPSDAPSGQGETKKGVASSTDKCFNCGGLGHWSRDCKAKKQEGRKAKGSGASTSGIFVIEVNVSYSSSWVLDTGCGSHICTNVQGLRRTRRLAEGEIDLRVGNGARVAALSVGTYDLVLPSGLVLSLESCYYVPALSRNIISVSCLDKSGFSFAIKNNSCSIYRNDLFYGIAHGANGLYTLDMQTPVYNLNTKRLKSANSDNNPTYL